MDEEDDLLLGSHRGQRDPSEFDRTSADIPIWGWLSGADARNSALAGENASRRNEGFWNRLGEHLPSADDLSVEYGEEGFVPGGESVFASESESDAGGRNAMEDALAQMQGWAHGGLTDTDRAMMDETARRDSMTARGDREAALAAMEARGLGGSGVELASRMGADEAAHARTSAANTGMLAAAQQRQIDASRSAASIGGALAGSDDSRLSGLENWNARENEYARGLENRNTERRNRSRESAAEAEQTAYQNRERRTAGITNQYSTDTNRRDRDAERGRESDRDLAATIGAALGSL